MYMLVRYTDEEESAIAAVIRIAGHRQPLQWHLNKFRPNAMWNGAGTRARAVGTNESDTEFVYFGIESVERIDGYATEANKPLAPSKYDPASPNYEAQTWSNQWAGELGEVKPNDGWS